MAPSATTTTAAPDTPPLVDEREALLEQLEDLVREIYMDEWGTPAEVAALVKKLLATILRARGAELAQKTITGYGASVARFVRAIRKMPSGSRDGVPNSFHGVFRAYTGEQIVKVIADAAGENVNTRQAEVGNIYSLVVKWLELPIGDAAKAALRAAFDKVSEEKRGAREENVSDTVPRDDMEKLKAFARENPTKTIGVFVALQVLAPTNRVGEYADVRVVGADEFAEAVREQNEVKVAYVGDDAARIYYGPKMTKTKEGREQTLPDEVRGILLEYAAYMKTYRGGYAWLLQADDPGGVRSLSETYLGNLNRKLKDKLGLTVDITNQKLRRTRETANVQNPMKSLAERKAEATAMGHSVAQQQAYNVVREKGVERSPEMRKRELAVGEGIADLTALIRRMSDEQLDEYIGAAAEHFLALKRLAMSALAGAPPKPKFLVKIGRKGGLMRRKSPSPMPMPMHPMDF